jgi:high-affinity Fe2+/Pb2+ permease
MKQLITGFSLAAISAVVTITAFAEGGQGIGRAGTYQVSTQTQESAGGTPKTRAQVRAELVAAYSNGSLPALNRNTYPERSMWGDAIAAQNEQRLHDAAQAEARNREIVDYANGSATQGNVTAR